MSTKFLYYNKTKNASKLFVTVVVVILSVCSAFAQKNHPVLGGGSGKQINPYRISKPEHLDTLARYVNAGNGNRTADAYYKLMDNIDLGTLKEKNWTPIGNSTASCRFKGNFDGNKKIVTNLTIDRQGADFIGLFGYIESANIHELGIENCNIVGRNHVGGMVGYNDSSNIINCYVTGNIEGENNVAGVAGENRGLIKHCYAGGKVTGKTLIGGIAGTSYGNFVRIQYCVAAQDSLINIGTEGGHNISRIGFLYTYDTVPEHMCRKNYAYDDMVLVKRGTSKMNIGLIRNEGADKSIVMLQNRYHFYTWPGYWRKDTLSKPEPWDFNDIWQINDNDSEWIYYSSRLPIFKGQDFEIGIYDKDDKENLRKFLRQQSAATLDSLRVKDNWEKDEAWVEKLRYVYWNIENPKRLIGIGNGDFTERDPWEAEKRFGGWSTKGLKGDLDASAWAKLKHLNIHTSSDRLGNAYKNIQNRIESLKLGTKKSLKTLICDGNELDSLDVSECTALEHFTCTRNRLSYINLTGISDALYFSGGGQKITLKMRKNNADTDTNYGSGPISLFKPIFRSDTIRFNNPLFLKTDGIGSIMLITKFSISYSDGSLTCAEAVDATGFVAQTGLTGKRIGGVISFKYVDVDTYTVTPIAGRGCRISPNTVQTVEGGSSITFTAMPIPRKYNRVLMWTVNGVIVQIGGNSYTISDIQEDTTIKVTLGCRLLISEKIQNTLVPLNAN